MNRATLIGIGAAALVAVGAAVMVGRDDAATAPAKPLPLYPGLIERLNDVVELRIEAKTGSLVIAQAEGDAWIMPEKGGYPAKFDAVKKALLGVAEIKTIEAKTAKPELYSKIAVEDRSAKDSGATLVTLKGKDGKPAAELLIGKADRVATDTKPGSYYARKAGDPQSWLVSGSLAIEPTLNRWVESKLFEIPRKRVTSAVIKRGDGDGVAVVKRAGSEDDFDLTTPLPAGRKLIAPTTPGVVAAALDYLPFDDVAKAEARSQDPIEATAIYTTEDGMVVTVTARKAGEKFWVTFKPMADPAKAPDETVAKEIAEIEARVGGWAYQMPDYRVENFAKKLEQMLEKPEDAKK